MVCFVKYDLLFLRKKSICLVSLDSIYSRFAPIRYILALLQFDIFAFCETHFAKQQIRYVLALLERD